jgi:AGZA family xanthine/uracil permease-like MFS transporter
MKKFVKGDLDGLFALGLDTLIMFLLMSNLCLGLLGFSEDLFYGRILPAMAIGLIIGNVFYARQALKLAEKENRDDVCAIPYGPNLVTVIVYGFLVMYPAQQKAIADGLSKEAADIISWQAGLIACLGSGLIEFLGAFVVEKIRKVTPRAALLAALAGIGMAFIGMDYVLRTYAIPLIGFTTLAITLIVYFGRVRFKMGLPGGLVILTVGTGIAWILFHAGAQTVVPVGSLNTAQIGLKIPIPVFGDLAASSRYFLEYLPIIAPMGFINLVLSLQNIESAAAAGDSYESTPALAFNGLGTIGAAIFGCPFPTSIYIGHPGWKAIGARAGYSSANAVLWSIVCFTGTLSFLVYFIPIEAGMAILIWIGIMMGAQAFQATPRHHAPAVIIGIIPVIAAYVALAVKHALFVAEIATGQILFKPEINDSFVAFRQFYTDGAFALEQGWVYTSIILSAATVCIIERKFRHASIWFLVGAFLSCVGFMHTYEFATKDVIGHLAISMPKWACGYLIMAAILYVTPWITEETDTVGP